MPHAPTPMLDSMFGFPTLRASEIDLFRLQAECARLGLVLSRGDAAIMLMSAKDFGRFTTKLAFDADACWPWTGRRDPAGYGTLCINHTTVYAHRVAYRLITGMTPPSHLEIDHLCRNRACVRPDHLEAVSHEENVYRGVLARRSPPR